MISNLSESFGVALVVDRGSLYVAEQVYVARSQFPLVTCYLHIHITCSWNSGNNSI